VCVTVDNDANAFVATYETVNGWRVNEVHFAAGKSLTDIPVNNKGQPAPGQFPYVASGLDTDSFSFTIPLAVIGRDASETSCDRAIAHFAAHAVVSRTRDDGSVQKETGWADGTRFVTRGSWAQYYTLQFECYEDTPVPPTGVTCETAFGKVRDGEGTAKAFSFDGEVASRWGWTNEIAAGDFVFDLYAGAAQNDISKGVFVGTVAVKYANGTVAVDYGASLGFYFDETHTYAGKAEMPKNAAGNDTVAPGAMKIGTDLEGNIHVITKAVACGNF
jgi:hypothetical protein